MKHKQEYRMLGICKYCGQEIYGKHRNKYQAHQKWCLKNPNRNKAVEQLKIAGKHGSKIANTNKSIKANILNKKHKHILYCKKCNNPYEIWISDRDFEKERYPKYCSRTCSNSRILSNEVKHKIGKSTSKEHKHICPKCGCNFMHIGTGKTLCDNCFKETYNRPRGFLNANKQISSNSQYSWNKLGNDTVLHKTQCKECGKELWCKTTDDVYCYECAKELGKLVHQLYTPTGKKLVSANTKKKLKDLVTKRIENGTHNGWNTRNKHSYAELFWMKILDNNNISYEDEANVPGYLYRLDFKITLPNGRIIDLEIDGKQHFYDDRNKHDQIRDKRLRALGYLVYRIQWNNIKNKFGKMRMKAKINQFLWWFNQMCIHNT